MKKICLVVQNNKFEV